MSKIVAHAASTDSRIGAEVAGYRIERLLGRGGMSTVYLAEDIALGRKVALKLLSPELSEDESFRARFRLESRLAASIDHPNVIPIYEAGQADDGTLFIVMRYVEGADLKRTLREEGALESERTVELLAQAARGLDEAHARGLVHRDVKPSNVLIARSEVGTEHVYLADFGLTKTSTSHEDASESIALSGSTDYVSPEQIRGGGSDDASDIYALGCVAYECLTGEVPFPRTGELQVLFAHMNDEPPAPSTANRELPLALDEVTAKAMAKDPAERYRSGMELVDAIREATAPPPPRLSKRSIALLAGLLAAVIAGAVVAAVLLTGGDGSPAAPDPDNSTIETIAGTGVAGFSGDGGPAIAAELRAPWDVIFDSVGNLYFSDADNRRIRKIDRGGVINTIAGTGEPGRFEDGIPALEAALEWPGTLGFDVAGNLYFADFTRGVVRKIDTDGLITTVAGGGERHGFAADSGVATETQLRKPWITVDADGVLYIADEGHNRILRVDPGGAYTTIAGTTTIGVSGDGGPATEAEIAAPTRIAIAPDGSIYFSDFGNKRIRRIDPEGIITTVTGTGVQGFSGDGGPATQARIADPGDLVFDAEGNLYFSDSVFGTPADRSEFGNRVRRIDTDGIVTTVAGTGEAGFSGDGGPATEAKLRFPEGLAVDGEGNLYIVDGRNHRIRKVTFE